MITAALPRYTGARFFTVDVEPADRMEIEFKPREDVPAWQKHRARASSRGAGCIISARACFKSLGIEEPKFRVVFPTVERSSATLTHTGLDLAAVMALLDAAGVVSFPEDHVFYSSMSHDRLKWTRGVLAVLRAMKPGMVLHTSRESVALVERHIPDGVTVYTHQTIEDVVYHLGVKAQPKPWVRPVSTDRFTSLHFDVGTARRIIAMAIGDHPGVVTDYTGQWWTPDRQQALIRFARFCRSLAVDDRQLIEADIIQDAVAGAQVIGDGRPQPIAVPRDDSTASMIDGQPNGDGSASAYNMHRLPVPASAHAGVLLLEDLCGMKADGVRATSKAWHDRSCSKWPADFMLLGFELDVGGNTAADQYAEIVGLIKDAGRDPSHIDPHENRAARVGFHIELKPDFMQVGHVSSDDVKATIKLAIETRRERGQEEPNGRLTDSEIANIYYRSGVVRDYDWVFSSPFDVVEVRTRLLRVARTLADMDGSTNVLESHMLDARSMLFIRPPMKWRW